MSGRVLQPTLLKILRQGFQLRQQSLLKQHMTRDIPLLWRNLADVAGAIGIPDIKAGHIFGAAVRHGINTD